MVNTHKNLIRDISSCSLKVSYYLVDRLSVKNSNCFNEHLFVYSLIESLPLVDRKILLTSIIILTC